MHPARFRSVAGLFAVAVGVSACAGASLPPPGTTSPITTSGNSPLTLVDPLGVTKSTGLTGSVLVPGNLVSVYSRLARGLNRCWLRDGRPLGREYVMYAKVDPAPATSGSLTVHLRAALGRRGLKAYSIDLSDSGGQTRVTTTNLKLLPRQSAGIGKDVERWAVGGAGCAVRTTRVVAPARKPGRIGDVPDAF